MEKAKAYIKSSLASKPASPSAPAKPPAQDDVRVCFVCGGAGFSDQYTVRVKPDTQVTTFHNGSLCSHPIRQLSLQEYILCHWNFTGIHETGTKII